MPKKRRHKRHYNGPRHPAITTSSREGGGIALEVGGVVQSVSVPEAGIAGLDADPSGGPRPGPGDGYWGLMLPPGCPRRALLIGLGGGTVAALLARRCSGAEITGVERDPSVLAVARSMLGLDDVPRLKVVQADAFAWVAERAATEPGAYDLICLDLFNAGRLAPGALAEPFLRQIAALLALSGTLSINLMVTAQTPNQVARIEVVFAIARRLKLRGNLVLHVRRPDAPARAGLSGVQS